MAVYVSVKLIIAWLAATFVILSIYLYVDLPANVSDSWEIRQVTATRRLIGIAAGMGELLGVASRINTTRSLQGWVLRTPTDQRVQAMDASFAGVSVRLYRPVDTDSEDLPGVVYIPGGGWMYNDIDLYNGLASYLAAEGNVVVVSLQYRSAPEHLFPVGFDDCVTAIVHLLHNAKIYHIDRNHIAIAGDDSGGNLAAAVANRLSFETSLPPIKFHALFYPLLQAFDFNLPSFVTHATCYATSTYEIVSQWLHYYQGHAEDIGEFMANNHTDALMKTSEYADYVNVSLLPEQHRREIDVVKARRHADGNTTLAQIFERVLLNPYFSPLIATEVAALPPAYVVTVEYDSARDDGLMYVQRLRDEKVTVIHKHYASSGRGVLQTLGSFWEHGVAREIADDFVKFIRANL